MKNNHLINRIDGKELKGLYYCTACIKMTEGSEYDNVYDELIRLVKNTIEEKGCVEFFVTPSNLERGEFILWEIWKDREAFEFHHNAEYTKEFFSKKLTEIKWIEMDGEL